MEKKLAVEIKDFFDNIEFFSSEDVEKMNFYEACLYLEKLNVLDNLTNNGGNNNE